MSSLPIDLMQEGGGEFGASIKGKCKCSGKHNEKTMMFKNISLKCLESFHISGKIAELTDKNIRCVCADEEKGKCGYNLQNGNKAVKGLNI